MSGYQLVCAVCGLTSPRAKTRAQSRLLASGLGWQRGHFRRGGQPMSNPVNLCPECIDQSRGQSRGKAEQVK